MISINNLRIAILLSLLFSANFANAASLGVSKESFSLNKGDKFQLQISIDPEDSSNYTAKIRVDFPSNILSVSSFSMDRNWLVLPVKEYDEINNPKGYLVKTGGFPQGFRNKTIFGTINFEAKESGSGTITIGKESLVLDANNKNVLEGAKTVKVSVGSAEIAPTPTSPDAKFITRTEILNPVVSRPSDLEVKVVFEDFGSFQIPVDIRYLVLDKEENLVFEIKDGLIVQGAAEYIKKMDGLNVSSGEYILRVKTLVDQRIQGEQVVYFKVVDSKEIISIGIYPVILALGILILFLIIVVWMKRRKREEGSY